jgi:hypothetical protein
MISQPSDAEIAWISSSRATMQQTHYATQGFEMYNGTLYPQNKTNILIFWNNKIKSLLCFAESNVIGA